MLIGPGLSSPGSVTQRSARVDRRDCPRGSLFLDHLPARTAFAADVDERRLLSHDPGEAVASRCRSSWSSSTRNDRVFDQRLERVGVLAAVVPGEDAAVRHDRAGRLIVHEEVHEIDAVAHPLVGDPARELLVQPELEVQLRVEGAVRLRHQPLLPVGVLLADLLHFRAAAPARAVVVPHDFDTCSRLRGRRCAGPRARRAGTARCGAACRSGRRAWSA